MTTELLSVREVHVGYGAVVRAVEDQPDAVRPDHKVVEAYPAHDD